MRILLLADPASAHVIKWANGLHKKGIEISIFGLSTCDHKQYHQDILLEIFTVPQFIKWQSDGNFLKLAYLFGLPRLKKLIRKIKPDIIHAHSASSYGFLGALSKFHPFVISVWGKDVYRFPQKSKLFKNLIKYNFKNADHLFSTSRIMALETKKYTDKQIDVIPFGIDTQIFKPRRNKGFYSEDDIVIGTIKSLEKKYGTEYLVKAFKKVKENHPDLPLRLMIVGRGSLTNYIKSLTVKLGIESDVLITGLVGYDKIPDYHRMLDIYVAVSTEDSESFGVAILEASACEKPVVVSNVGGLPEVVDDGITGFVIPHSRVEPLVEKLELLLEEDLRRKMGKAGRERVKQKFYFEENLNTLIESYKKIINN